jgi:Spy/CpxP family protein refolding chaperone
MYYSSLVILSLNFFTMKNIFLFGLVLSLLGFIAACNDPKTASTEDATGTEQSGEPAAQAPQQNTKAANPAERFTKIFDQLGLALTPEQSQQITDIAAKYDLQAATDKETRRAKIAQFQAEVTSTVLTPEQAAAYTQKQQENKQKREANN